MPPEPGPIDVLDPAAFDLTPEDPGWGAWLTEELQPLDGEHAALASGLADLEAGVVEEWRPELEQLRAEAEEGIYGDPDCGDQGEVDDALAVAPEIDELVIEAYSETPGEAWEPVPTAYQPPPEQGGFVELPSEVEPVRPDVPVQPPPQAPPPATPTVQMLNLSGGPPQLYHVGDFWNITVTGPPNSPVTCQAWHEGVQLWPVTFGMTNEWGRFDTDGQMTGDVAGYWVQNWAVAGVPCTPTISFVVQE